MLYSAIEVALMINLCRGVQGSVQGSVQGKLRISIGLCKVCKAFTHMRAREIQNHITHTICTLARVMRACTPAHLAQAAPRLRFTPAQTLAHNPAHLAHKKN
jgi:hypothetical protein